MTERTLAEIIEASIQLGTVATLTRVGLMQPYISYTEATKIAGRSQIDRWVSEGLLDKIKDGEKNCKVRFLRERVHVLLAASNRKSWFKHKKSFSDMNTISV